MKRAVFLLLTTGRVAHRENSSEYIILQTRIVPTWRQTFWRDRDCTMDEQHRLESNLYDDTDDILSFELSYSDFSVPTNTIANYLPRSHYDALDDDRMRDLVGPPIDLCLPVVRFLHDFFHFLSLGPSTVLFSSDPFTYPLPDFTSNSPGCLSYHIGKISHGTDQLFFLALALESI